MKLERRIQRTFGLRPTARPSPAHLTPEDDVTLAYLGYPTLKQVNFFLDSVSLKRWRAEQTLVFPSACCVCMEPSRKHLSTLADSNWFGLFAKGEIINTVPHCDKHGQSTEACLLFTLKAWTEDVLSVSLIGLNEQFLLETEKLTQNGQPLPPWLAFPGYDPYASGWRQGNGEYWINTAWRPFWDRLTHEAQEEYLRTWNAPEDWWEWLELIRAAR